MPVTNITFFFPYPYISGIPVLFSNVANYLLEKKDIQVNIIDYENGALIRSCHPDKSLNHIVFRDFTDCVIDFETCLVLQAGIPYKLREELKIGKDVKILEWAAFEYNLVPYLNQLMFIRRLQEKYFGLYKIFWYANYWKSKLLSQWTGELIERGSILFMTKIIYEVTEKYLCLSGNVPVKYLPNFSSGSIGYSAVEVARRSEEVKDKLHLAWVGRIADFKIEILNYSLCSLAQLAETEKKHIYFHIIGDGEFAGRIRNDCQNDFFKIISVGSLSKAKVDEYIAGKIHALFSMGTSALDGARLGLPVILLDYSYSEIKGPYVFRYLYDTRDYDLGHPLTKADFIKKNESLKIILNELINQYEEKSQLTISYFKGNHSVETVVEKLLHFFETNYYFHTEIPALLRERSLSRKAYLWYVKNIKKTYYPAR